MRRRFPRPPRPEGSFPVRVRPAGKTRWSRGHAAWVHDVLVVRAGPPARREALFRVAGMWERAPTSEERWWIHRLGGDMFLATLVLEDGTSVDVAARRSVRPALLDGVPLGNAA